MSSEDRINLGRILEFVDETKKFREKVDERLQEINAKVDHISESVGPIIVAHKEGEQLKKHGRLVAVGLVVVSAFGLLAKYMKVIWLYLVSPK